MYTVCVLNILRVLTDCFMLVGSAMFGATVNLVTHVITVIFGTPKNGSLKIQVYHQIIVSATETSYKKVFCPKAPILYILDIPIWFKFRQHVVQICNK